jgi:hypothetical protein
VAQTRSLSPSHGRLRAFLLAILLLGIIGTGIELILLEHTEDRLQWIPLILLGIGAVITSLVLVVPRAVTIHALRAVMAAFIVAGVAGVILHYRGNVEFELEMYPAMRGLELFRSSMKGATPALAPGTMAQLGLLGLACTYRHPRLRGRTAAGEARKEAQ